MSKLKSKAVQLTALQSIIDFFRGVRAELQKAVWPTRDQVIKLTGLVIATSLLIGSILGAFDALFFSTLTWLRQVLPSILPK